jgi:hypothetical protein
LCQRPRINQLKSEQALLNPSQALLIALSTMVFATRALPAFLALAATTVAQSLPTVDLGYTVHQAANINVSDSSSPAIELLTDLL